eukprot:jgi/Chrzof1/14007/Cz08g20280.t1
MGLAVSKAVGSGVQWAGDMIVGADAAQTPAATTVEAHDPDISMVEEAVADPNAPTLQPMIVDLNEQVNDMLAAEIAAQQKNSGKSKHLSAKAKTPKAASKVTNSSGGKKRAAEAQVATVTSPKPQPSDKQANKSPRHVLPAKKVGMKHVADRKHAPLARKSHRSRQAKYPASEWYVVQK